MDAFVKKLKGDLYTTASEIRFFLMGREEKRKFLDSKRSVFFHEMCATLELLYGHSKLSPVYPSPADIVFLGYEERIKKYEEFEKEFVHFKLHQRLSKLVRNGLTLGLGKGDRIWFLYPSQGSFCRVYVADFVARDLPFLVRCAKLCAACWHYYHKLYDSGGKDIAKLRDIPAVELAKNSYLALIGVGMGAWLNKNLETVVISEKEALKKSLGRMHDIGGDMVRLRETLGSFDGKPNKREVCELMFAHIAHVNKYLIGLFESQEAVTGEEMEIASERSANSKKKATGFLNRTEKAAREHMKLLEKMAGPLERISGNLSNPAFPMGDSRRDFSAVRTLDSLPNVVERVSKEKAYEAYELKMICSAFHHFVHNELGYLNRSIRREQRLP